MGLIPGCNKDLVLVVEGLGYKPEGDGLNMCVHALQPKWLKPSPFVREVFFFSPRIQLFFASCRVCKATPCKDGPTVAILEMEAMEDRPGFLL